MLCDYKISRVTRVGNTTTVFASIFLGAVGTKNEMVKEAMAPVTRYRRSAKLQSLTFSVINGTLTDIEIGALVKARAETFAGTNALTIYVKNA